jgi:hypothetical protein
VRGLEIMVDEASISRVSNLPMGFPWDKEERHEATNAKKLFFHKNEKPQEGKNGIKRESLLQPWLEVAYHIIKYITCEGRMSMVYDYHFGILHRLRHCYSKEPTNSLILPYFLLQSLKEMGTKVKRGKHEFLAHHRLIKKTISNALGNLKHRVPWVDFSDMDKQYFLEMQAEMM